MSSMCDTVLRVGSSPCCSWDADKRWRMLKSQDILESTRVPDPTAHYYGETGLDMASSYPTAIIEMNERDQDVSGGGSKKRKMYQAYKGQLKLSIGVNYGNLTVHVAQARHLLCKSKATCDTFVKVAMVPKPSDRTTCLTTLVPDTNHPVYDEKFTYELLGCDYERRMQISVFHHDTITGLNELIGCMSFGIKNIAKKKTVVSGWYYLLAEKLGSYKHMMVKENPVIAACPDPTASNQGHRNPLEGQQGHRPLKRCRQNSHGSTGSNGSSDTAEMCESAELSAITTSTTLSSSTTSSRSVRQPQPTPPIMQLLSIPVVNRRSKGGYGFTLVDGHPSKISKIEFGSPADICGLQEGDQIIRVNGQSVHTMYAEAVGRVIKHYPRCIVLEVLRCSVKVPESVAVSVRSNFMNRVSKEIDDYSSDEDDSYSETGSCYSSHSSRHQRVSFNREHRGSAFNREHRVSAKASLRVEPLVVHARREVVPLVVLDANHNNLYK